jgi:hypothetical protein
MSRDLSDNMKRALYDERSGEVFAVLITIDHADLDPPLRATSNEEPIKQNEGETTEVTFVPYGFELTWPNDHQARPPLAQLRIGNVDRVIVQTLRQLASPPTVTLQLVLASAPDTVEAELPDFDLVEADYDALVVEGQLTLESFENEPWPYQRYTPASHPGLFPV